MTNDGLLAALRGSPFFDDKEADPAVALKRGHFLYAKAWLRAHAPWLSIDYHELEINARFALILPSLLSAGVVIRLLTQAGATLPLIGIVSIFAGVLALAGTLAWFLLRQGLQGRINERQDALRHYVVARAVLEHRPSVSEDEETSS